MSERREEADSKVQKWKMPNIISTDFAIQNLATFNLKYEVDHFNDLLKTEEIFIGSVILGNILAPYTIVET